MKCEEVDAKMIDYLDNNLEDGIREEIEKHIETCERCLDELKDSQQVLNLFSKDKMIQPDDSLRINFYHMLHGQISKSEGNAAIQHNKPRARWFESGRYRIAAGIAILIFGTFIGMMFHGRVNNYSASTEIRQLHSEVSELRKATMFTMLKEESSSDRIQAVGYAEDLQNADQNVIDVLVKTLNNDKSVNVRMAAAYALSKFADKPQVCDSLVKSLSVQNDPILQVTLINILAERKVKSALVPIEKIIANKSTLREVRAVAENSLRVLI
jgi:HEAT repeats/Putative zinc-finger